MGVDIHGWIEMSRLGPPERSHEYAWAGILDISCLIDGCDEVSQALFGFSKHALCGGFLSYNPVAQNRGIPTNPSESVQAELRAIHEHECKFGSGESQGYTYIDFEEIESVDWQQYEVHDLESSDWATIFKLIRTLRTDQRFAGAGIRLVCWAV